MKTRLQISVRRTVAFCLMVAGALLARATEEVLWWQVPDDATVATFHQGDVLASELGADEARIITSAGDYLVIPPDADPPPDDVESLVIPMGAAWFAILPDSPEGLSFMVELGNWDNDGNWVGIAQSQSYTYAQLQDYVIRDWSGPGATPAIQPWVAEGYVVPEPSSGILLLIGGGLLALRRKRRARG